MYLFVDDFQSGYHRTDIIEWNEIKQLLLNEFNTKDLGASVWMLGMRITRDRVNHTLLLDQETYVKDATSDDSHSDNDPDYVDTQKETVANKKLDDITHMSLLY